MSNKIYKEFNNELGNPILVEAEEKDIAGVPGILLAITGPTSKAENHVTRAEAKEILTALEQLLKQ